MSRAVGYGQAPLIIGEKKRREYQGPLYEKKRVQTGVFPSNEAGENLFAKVG